MKRVKWILIGIGSFVILIFFMFLMGIINLEFLRFFKPKLENVNRETFEQTKSYVHGAIQDIAKYYDEYHKENSDKNIIENAIKVRFAEFNTDNIKSEKLKRWFIEVRGY